ncbi:MAG: dihydrolipoamide acetyltransferase family protein, partial [Pseudomonadota bacterium]|nr:dihydrolipoamide acetyltransferase family protein [Pseudomonadota bacterium]
MADLLMPKFGLTMTEGLVSDWHVAPGEPFEAGQLLYTVETEKVANEVDAETAGTLAEILVPAGETVAVGTPVARLKGDGAAQDAVRDAPSARRLMAEHGMNRDQVAPSGRGGRVLKEDVLRVIATPLARRIAGQKGVDLHAITGSGASGRIKAADVHRAAETAPTPAPTSARGGQSITPDAARLATARRVTASKRDIPHFYVTHEAEISALLDLRAQLNAGAGQGGRAKISVTHMLIKALGLALAEMPGLNRIWAGDAIHTFDSVDVGMVAETPQGLRIPVLRDVGKLALDDLAKVAATLAGRARSGALRPGDVGDSVVSISNVGMFGVSTLTPIINPPNAMILGVGAERALFRPGPDGTPLARRELVLTLAADHRIVYGADAARFLAQLVALIEAPVRLLRPPRVEGL